MKNVLFLLFLVVLSGCGIKGDRGEVGPKGDKGDPGIPGTSCTSVLVPGGINIICGSNPPVFLRDGADGAPGLQGPVGLPGTSCTVTTLLPSHDNPTGGAQITCGSQSAVVINGAAGGSGAAYVIVGSIDPCGASSPTSQDEIFLRMASGALVSLFTENSSALTARLSYIKDGSNYQTTDSQHCLFSLATDINGVRTITYTSPVTGSESWQTY